MNNFFLTFLLSLSFFAKGQSITGTVKSEDIAIPGALVYIKQSSGSGKILSYTETDQNGNFAVKNSPAEFILEIRAMDYETYSLLHRMPLDGESLQLTISLKLQPLELKEVVITQKPAMQQRKDTVIYNVDKFKDGSEKVIEDVLKKLPGVKIDNKGNITYNGKEIKKLLFDGDDLFSSAYATGSKNIDSDMIESVEAYKNYNEYAQLKGITNDEDDVALNIKLKKDRGSITSGLYLGAGHRDVWDSRANTMIITSGLKTFALAGYNNVNRDFGNNGIENRVEKSPPTLISESIVQNAIDEKYTQLRKSFLSDIHSLYKFSESTSLRVAGSYSSERFNRINEGLTVYAQPNDITIRSSENTNKSPKTINVSSELKSNLSKTNFLEYSVDFLRQHTELTSNVNNNGELRTGEIRSNRTVFLQELRLISRVGDSVGLQASVTHSFGESPQHYYTVPGAFAQSIRDDQFAAVKRQSVLPKVTLSGISQRLKWNTEAGYAFHSEHLDSDLKSLPSTANEMVNRSLYERHRPYISGTLLYKRKKFALKTGLRAEYFGLKLEQRDTAAMHLEKFWLTPSIQSQFLFGESSGLTLGYEYAAKEPTLDNLFSRNVLINYRSLKSNVPNLELLPVHNANLRFAHGNIFNLPMWETRLSWQRSTRNYFYRNFISDQLSVSSGSLVDQPASTYGAAFNFKNYFSPLKLTYEFDISYSDMNAKTTLNSVDFLDSRNQVTTLVFTLRNKSRAKVFLENVATYMYFKSSLEGASGNDFSQIEDKFRLVYRFKEKFRFEADARFYYPDVSKSQTYCFIDAGLYYNSNHRIDYSLTATNILNHKTFETTYINELSRSVTSFNLMRAYILGTMSFKF